MGSPRLASVNCGHAGLVAAATDFEGSSLAGLVQPVSASKVQVASPAIRRFTVSSSAVRCVASGARHEGEDRIRASRERQRGAREGNNLASVPLGCNPRIPLDFGAGGVDRAGGPQQNGVSIPRERALGFPDAVFGRPPTQEKT
jgi:hypothetical protein